jgi:1-phosphatidylinositol-3-phosphate 5-kinase
MGFYTIEIRNLETGAVQAKADLLVMENLFYGQTIAKTFDLKGIQGRRVKTKTSTSKTLFDGDWIEGNYRLGVTNTSLRANLLIGQEKALTLVYPHSKVILQEALRLDCEFLANSNIMDYSYVNEVFSSVSFSNLAQITTGHRCSREADFVWACRHDRELHIC